MLQLSCLCVLALVSAVTTTPNNNTSCTSVDPVLNTTSGPVCGIALPSGGRQFLGIPYAAAPTGSRRWMVPSPPEPWSGSSPRSAKAFGPGCLQLHHNPDVPEPQSEDCLSLNIYTPNRQVCKSQNDFAAFLWFHGGSFEEGGSSLFYYNGSALAHRECVVVVTANYRLGAFGNILVEGAVGNQNLHDQRAVMQWVHNNAAALHIDTARVTIGGQSAGAMSVGFHLTSPNSTKYFSRAIMESNVAGYPYKTSREGLQYGNMFMKDLGCKDLACMQSKTADEVKQAQSKIEKSVPGILDIVVSWKSLDIVLPFTPTVMETPDFPLQPAEAFKTGKAADIPVLMGTNEGDAILFVACGKNNLTEFEWNVLLDAAFLDKAGAVRKAYPETHPASKDNVEGHLNAVFTDFLFRCPSRRFGTKGTGRKSPTFMYRFNHSLTFNVYNKSCCDNKACHGEEIPLVFHATGPFVLDPVSEQLSSTLMSYWGSFIRTGDPNPPNNDTPGPEWPQQQQQLPPQWPASGATGQTMWLQKDLQVRNSTGHVCDNLWDTFTPFWDRAADD
eukprot:m.68490 g.68490  ORF g.68490 m.68490 type:complete len:557 (-) comp13911_c0_seq1:1443-3113(-)